jgi:hypothetical protein
VSAEGINELGRDGTYGTELYTAMVDQLVSSVSS